VSRWQRQQAAAENRHRDKIESALNAQLNTFVSYADANGLAIALSLVDNIITPDPLQPVIHRLYIAEGTRSGQNEQRLLNQQFGDEYKSKAFEFFTNWVQEMTNFFYSFGMQAITRMTDTTKEQVRKKVAEGLDKQESYPEIRDRLIGIEDVNKKRANVIARTETVSAMGYSRQQAALSLPFRMIKIWRAIRDKRTRHSHVAINGEEAPLTAPYSNGGMYPGDPELIAKERIQCRCTETYQPLRDAAGRPIRK
jgi:hypothetical protein